MSVIAAVTSCGKIEIIPWIKAISNLTPALMICGKAPIKAFINVKIKVIAAATKVGKIEIIP